LLSAYVQNDPLNNTDPSGEAGCRPTPTGVICPRPSVQVFAFHPNQTSAGPISREKANVLSQAVSMIGAAGVGKVTTQLAVRTATANGLTVAKLAANYKILWGKSAETIAAAFRKAGYKVIIKQSSKGSGKARIIVIQGHPKISQIQVHPGGGIHRGPYIKISTNNGKIKVINSKYKPTLEKNTTYERVWP